MSCDPKLSMADYCLQYGDSTETRCEKYPESIESIIQSINVNLINSWFCLSRGKVSYADPLPCLFPQ